MKSLGFLMCIPVALGLSAAPARAAGDDLKERLAGYYEPVGMPDVKPAVPQTPLPLTAEKVGNWYKAQQFIPAAARDAFSRDALVVTDALQSDKVEEFYKLVKDKGLPVFITSDSLLHLYHIQFDETLQGIEEAKFSDDLLALTVAVQAEGEANGMGAAYFTVARRLLDENAPIDNLVKVEVQKELSLIEAHRGFAESPIFKYQEDYSQYAPRGHYTRSEKLKKYFKAMMWYGRMAFLIKGRTAQTPDALVSDSEARMQTQAALEIADILRNAKLPDGRKASDVWDRIYSVTAYYAGFADDLTPKEYALLLPLENGAWIDLQMAVAKMRAPAIYGGTGEVSGPPPEIATVADLDKALGATQGMRFMGQRFVSDSYVMGRLVYPSVGKFTGQGTPFTLSKTQAGPIRGFPRGYDVMAVIGSARAREILRQRGDDAYQGYDEQLKKLEGEFSALSEKDWNRNMYWSWLNGLRALLAPTPEGYPTFMRSAAWTDKELNASLGSWAQLRHDTILYAKQSYTMMLTAVAPSRLPPEMIEGYVEPVPEFYARLLALTRMSLKGLDDMKVLDEASRDRLISLDTILLRLLDVSVRELKNEKLSEEDYDFIRNFGNILRNAVAGVRQEGLETTLIADVHTDSNSGMALEEGTGELRAIAVAYPMPDGSTVVGFGPVFSVYEFKQPMADRLTDEAWKKFLRTGGAPKAQWGAD